MASIGPMRHLAVSIRQHNVNMASNVVDLLKIAGRSRTAALRMLLQQSTQATELQCRSHVDRCSRCWLSYSCHKAVGPERPTFGQFLSPYARGLQTLTYLQQKICKKYDNNGTKCCSDE